MSMGRVNCHTHAAPPRDVIAAFVLDPAFARHITLRASSRRAGAATPPSGKPQPYTAPRSSQQPTLVSGCEAHPAASDKRRGDKRKAYSLRKDGNDEIFFHDGETCA